MKFRNQFLKFKVHGNRPLFQDENNGDGGGDTGGGGGTPPVIDMTNPAVADAIQAAVDKGVAAGISNIKAHNEKLIEEKNKYRDSAKQFDGVNMDEYNAYKARIENDEEQKLISEGKIDEVFNIRTERLRSDYDAKLAAATDNAATFESAAKAATTKYENTVIDNAVRNEALKSGVLPEALEDVVQRARGVFSISDGGKLEARDVDGVLLTSVDGVNAFTAKDFMESLKERAAYYWPGSVSANMAGNNGGGSGADSAADKLAKAAASGDMEAFRAARKKK
jgi:hypothetical protein